MGFKDYRGVIIKKKLIIINGTMGVGKTSVCKALNKRLEKSVWLDGDWCWQMHPFEANEENKKMVEDNIQHLLLNFIKNSNVKDIIFSWVIPTEKLLNTIIDWFSDQECRIHIMTLMASDQALISRIHKDVSLGIREEKMIEWSLEKQKGYHRMATLKIDTTHQSVDQVVNEIVNRLG
jgi:broad-specificity NMP kinase